MDDNIFSTSRSLQEKVSIKIQDGIVIINTLKLTVIVTAVLKSKRPKKKGKLYVYSVFEFLYMRFKT